MKLINTDVISYINKYNIEEKLLNDIFIISDDLKQRALTKLGEIYYLQKNYDKAISTLKYAISNYPYRSHLYLNMAIILDKVKDSSYIYYLKIACEKNPFLKENMIYTNGSNNSQYIQQGAVYDSIIHFKSVIEGMYSEKR